MGIFLTLFTFILLLPFSPVTQSPTLIHQDNYFHFILVLFEKKSIRRELWRSPDFSFLSEQSIFKVRSDCSVNCSGQFWICKSGDSTVFLRLSCSIYYAPELAVPLCSAGISLAMICDCCFLGIHCMPLRRVSPWLLSIPLKSGKLLRSTLSLSFSWLNKTSSLRLFLQIMGLQQPLVHSRHNTLGVASKMPDKGNNHLS